MSTNGRQTGRKWNIFARELDTILRAHGYRIGHLDDRSHIHPEKVRRLQRSLDEPRFHVLSPDDLERVSQDFGFSQDEQMRLRAALLATAMEEMLMDRIDVDAALAAADQFFPLLLETLQAHSNTGDGIGAVKGANDAANVPHDNRQDPIDDVITAIDGGLTALYLSYTNGHGQRTSYILQSRDRFASALATLDTLTVSPVTEPTWQIWHTAAYSGYLAAGKLLAHVPEST